MSKVFRVEDPSSRVRKDTRTDGAESVYALDNPPDGEKTVCIPITEPRSAAVFGALTLKSFPVRVTHDRFTNSFHHGPITASLGIFIGCVLSGTLAVAIQQQHNSDHAHDVVCKIFASR